MKKPKTDFETKMDQYRDMRLDAHLMCFFGCIGFFCAFLPLDQFGDALSARAQTNQYIKWLQFVFYAISDTPTFVKAILGTLFVALLVLGIYSSKKAQRYYIEEAWKEKVLIAEMLTWLEETLPKESLSTPETAALSEDAHFSLQVKTIKEALTKQFADRQPEDALLDYIATEHYTSIF